MTTDIRHAKEGYTTPEGHWLPRPLLLPDARAFSDVLEYLGEWQDRYGWHGNTRPAYDTPAARIITNGKPSGNYYASGGEPGYRQGNEIGPYCTVDLRQLGGASHRSIAVRATDAVIDVVAPRIVTPDDNLSFKIIAHKGPGRALVILEHGYIIGSHWLAYIDPETIPAA